MSSEKLKMITCLVIEHHNLLHLILAIKAGYVKKKPERRDQEYRSYNEGLSFLQSGSSYCMLTLDLVCWNCMHLASYDAQII